ncbi:MAG: ABC transporter ATP-binding protein [Chloroflexi bacterium]|nr:ABC transporter ATP-binding protein [Chloroflexota bacterium]
MARPVIELHNICKIYRMGEIEVRALCGVTLSVEPGEILAIMGPSGSGKSTMMNIVGCLDQPTTGQYILEGQDVGQMDDDQLAVVRNRRIGFVFQTFNLLARTSALENVMLPLTYAGIPRAERLERAREALEAVGLGERMDHTPNELSGGQQQRVAIARALINSPAIILADEPTGNLDSRSGADVMTILQGLNRDLGITVILVTHDPRIARHTQRVLHLYDGQVVREELIDQPLVAVPGGEVA